MSVIYVARLSGDTIPNTVIEMASTYGVYISLKEVEGSTNFTVGRLENSRNSVTVDVLKQTTDQFTTSSKHVMRIFLHTPPHINKIEGHYKLRDIFCNNSRIK